MGGTAPYEWAEAVGYLEGLLPQELLIEPLYADVPPDLPLRPPVGPLAAALLEVIVRATRPARVLELGTSVGFAAIAMGRAAAEYRGRVVTVEVEERLAELARRKVAAAGLAETVEVVHSDAREYVAAVAGPFGLILQDSDKGIYEPLLARLVDLLEPGGLLVSDDVLFPIAELPESARRWQHVMDAYNRALRAHPELRTAWLPISYGLAVSVKTHGSLITGGSAGRRRP